MFKNISTYTTLPFYSGLSHLCISEYHLIESEIGLIHVDSNILGAKFRRQKIQKGGISTFVHNLQFTTLNPDSYFVDQDIEVWALQLVSTFSDICVLVIYRSPMGKFKNFITWLDTIQQLLYTPKLNLITCGDINVNDLNDNDKRMNWMLFKFLLSF